MESNIWCSARCRKFLTRIRFFQKNCSILLYQSQAISYLERSMYRKKSKDIQNWVFLDQRLSRFQLHLHYIHESINELWWLTNIKVIKVIKATWPYAYKCRFNVSVRRVSCSAIFHKHKFKGSFCVRAVILDTFFVYMFILYIHMTHYCSYHLTGVSWSAEKKPSRLKHRLTVIVH